MVFEGGESLRLDDFSIEKGLKAIKNLLTAQEILADKNKVENSVVFNGSKWTRSPSSGVFRSFKKAGDDVSKGLILGEVNQINSSKKKIIKSKFEGKLIGHRNNPVVVKGDALFHVAIK